VVKKSEEKHHAAMLFLALILQKTLPWLQNLDLVGQDGQVGKFHGGVLSDLLGVIGRGSALQDHSRRQNDDAQFAYAIAQPTQQHAFEPFLFR
jgi:hypothetical protein